GRIIGLRETGRPPSPIGPRPAEIGASAGLRFSPARGGSLSFGCRLSGYALRQLARAGLTVPFLECLRRDLPFDEKLGELASLGLAFERHASHHPGRVSSSFFSAARSF